MGLRRSNSTLCAKKRVSNKPIKVQQPKWGRKHSQLTEWLERDMLYWNNISFSWGSVAVKEESQEGTEEGNAEVNNETKMAFLLFTFICKTEKKTSSQGRASINYEWCGHCGEWRWMRECLCDFLFLYRHQRGLEVSKLETGHGKPVFESWLRCVTWLTTLEFGRRTSWALHCPNVLGNWNDTTTDFPYSKGYDEL